MLQQAPETIEEVANAKHQRGQLEESGVGIVEAGDLKSSSPEGVLIS
jgi:hypothetical protein